MSAFNAIRHAVVWAVANIESRLAAADSAALKLAAAKAMLELAGRTFRTHRGSTSTPEIRYMPAIIEFPGSNPRPEANGWGARLVRHRTSLRLSQKEAAEGRHRPRHVAAVGTGRARTQGALAPSAEAFLSAAKATTIDSRRGQRDPPR